MRITMYWFDGPWRGRLAIVPRPRGGDWLMDEIASWRAAGIDILVSALTDEEIRDFELVQEGDISREKGLQYLVFPIPDRGVPASFEKTEAFARKLDVLLAEGKNVAIHCRQGIGRSSLLAACTLILAGIDPAQAFQRIQTERGCAVPDTSEQRDWVVKFAKRLALVTKT